MRHICIYNWVEEHYETRTQVSCPDQHECRALALDIGCRAR